jgi:hypothetical protein
VVDIFGARAKGAARHMDAADHITLDNKARLVTSENIIGR